MIVETWQFLTICYCSARFIVRFLAIRVVALIFLVEKDLIHWLPDEVKEQTTKYSAKTGIDRYGIMRTSELTS